jgi:hypothetical protein
LIVNKLSESIPGESPPADTFAAFNFECVYFDRLLTDREILGLGMPVLVPRSVLEGQQLLSKVSSSLHDPSTGEYLPQVLEVIASLRGMQRELKKKQRKPWALVDRIFPRKR